MKINILGRTGPRSQKGKAISALNAIKHGGYAKTEVLPFEDAKERKRLERELYKALKPQDAIEERLVDDMVSSYWITERFKLRLILRQASIFANLTPQAIAQLIDIPEHYQAFAPEYLKEPDTKFTKREQRAAQERYDKYLHLMANSKGIANYQMVFGAYRSLFEGLHEYMGDDWAIPFLMPGGHALHISWQQDPKGVEEVLLEYAASLYYQIHMDTLRPAIRNAMSMWFFIGRLDKRESDLHDEQVIKEMKRYQALLAQFMKYRKANLDRLSSVDATTKQPPSAKVA